MGYSQEAIARRRCTGQKKNGEPCRAWALWDDPEQRCVCHAGRHHTGMRLPHGFSEQKRAAYTPCRCEAYAWPHRPGGGLCRWPEKPLYRRTTPAGTHRTPRLRKPALWRLMERELARRLEERKRRYFALFTANGERIKPKAQ